MASPAPGTHLHDRYVLRTRIGVGGMGEVWHAHDLRLDRPVAIKLIPGASERQIRSEAQAAARLSHPHIAGIYDFGDTGQGSAGYGYLVMELLTGQTLADRLAAGPMSWPEAADIAGQVASALAAAHDQHIVHRDIKPANIMLTASGVKVLDFGIAGAADREPDSSLIAGTPGYTAPERIRGGADGPAADVYGLAVVVYESLTGALPRPIATWQDLARAEFDAPVPMPAGVPPQCRAGPGRCARRGTATGDRPRRRSKQRSPVGRRRPRQPIAPMAMAPLTEPTIVTTRPAGVAAVPRAATGADHRRRPGRDRPGRSPARIALLAIAAVAVLIIALVALSSLHKPSGSQNAAGTAPTTTATTTTSSPSPSASASPSAARRRRAAGHAAADRRYRGQRRQPRPRPGQGAHPARPADTGRMAERRPRRVPRPVPATAGRPQQRRRPRRRQRQRRRQRRRRQSGGADDRRHRRPVARRRRHADQ